MNFDDKDFYMRKYNVKISHVSCDENNWLLILIIEYAKLSIQRIQSIIKI